MFDPHRSRWDGVLDREEYEYCRQHGVALAYDCAQIGWVTESCIDESSGLTTPMVTGTTTELSNQDAEQRTLELVASVVREAERVVAEVRDRRMSLPDARKRVTLAAALAMKPLANELSLSDYDLAHWALESAAATALAPIGDAPRRPAGGTGPAFGFRPWSADDAEVYAELLGNPRVWEYLPEPFPSDFSVDTARNLIEVGAIGFHHDTVAIEAEGRPIGQCLLRFDRPFAGTRAAEVAYWLGEEHWGQGWMSRVLPAFTHRSFREHGVDVVYAWIMEDNEASVRAAERAGYRRSPFPLEAQLAASLRRTGFVRYATYRVEWADLAPTS
jgi:[ribosomal protein S5]-alanine N-acetyltransferase